MHSLTWSGDHASLRLAPVKVENSNQSLHENEVWMSEYKGTGGDSTVQKSLPYPGEKSSGCCFQT
jgi:hypothetical protein